MNGGLTLGQVPHGWTRSTLQECFTLASGDARPREFGEDCVDSRNVPVYGGNGVSGFTDRANHHGQTVVIGRVGEYCGSVHYVGERCWITDNALFAELRGGHSHKYFSYLLHFLKLGRLRNKGGQPLISQRPIYLMEVVIPDEDEQGRIVGILGVWDSSIEISEVLIAVKRQQRCGLMQQLLTGRKRFKEFKGERWQTFKLGELFSERAEIGRGDLPLVSITGQNGVVPRDSLTKRDTSSEDKSKYLRIAPGDIGYNTMRMWQGVAGLSKLEGIVSPAYTICIPSKQIDGQFAAYLFKHTPLVHLFRRHSQGLVDDTLALKFPNFARIHVTIPKVPEQRRIAAVLTACDREIELLQKQLAALKEQKRGLMQKLLTGEVRVKPEMLKAESGKRKAGTPNDDDSTPNIQVGPRKSTKE